MLSSRWDETAPSRQRAGCGVAGGWITGEADGSRLGAAQPLGAAVHAVPRGPAEPAGPEPDHRAQPGHGEQRRRRADRRGPGRRGGSGRLRRWPAAHPAAGEPRPSVRGRGRCRRDAHPDRGLRPDDAPAGDGGQPARLRPVRSGVGAAVITNGTVYRGATSSAGEWGHTSLVFNGRPCRCGSRGCLEAYVGAEGVLDRYRQALVGGPAPCDDEESALASLLAAAATSRIAARVLAETADFLGAGIASLVNLFNPERIVLAGWAGHALGGQLLPQIRAAAAERALRHPFSQTTIQLGQLGSDAVALGAATLPVADLLGRGASPAEAGRRPPVRLHAHV